MRGTRRFALVCSIHATPNQVPESLELHTPLEIRNIHEAPIPSLTRPADINPNHGFGRKLTRA